MPRSSHPLVSMLVVALLLIPAALRADAPTFQEIEESLTCQCGCGLTVHSCNHLGCGSALPLRAEIREQMSQGKDKPAILAHFVEKYGEKILSSPTTKGFNLTAWVTPFALVALGGTFVIFTLMRWRSRSHVQRSGTPADPHASAQTEYEKILERELKEFDT
ncbi:MAG TPA: cytochrome c-type biogenesis protein CcmH [Candidatus Binatia bacterium]|nr:cytochrome c-type biogenesis protein CcmH [Candidatus Binatia bacterium]